MKIKGSWGARRPVDVVGHQREDKQAAEGGREGTRGREQRRELASQTIVPLVAERQPITSTMEAKIGTPSTNAPNIR